MQRRVATKHNKEFDESLYPPLSTEMRPRNHKEL